MTDFLIVSVITGENKEDMASKGERFILFRRNEIIYVAEILLSRMSGAWFPISRT